MIGLIRPTLMGMKNEDENGSNSFFGGGGGGGGKQVHPVVGELQ